MRRVIGFVILAAILLAIAFGIGGLNGAVEATVAGLTIAAPLPLVILALILLVVVAYVVLRLLGLLIAAPGRLGRGRQGRHQRQGERAVTRAMVAIAAADSRSALKEAARARRLMPQAPLARLVSAEAHRLAGREEAAEAEFRGLSEQQDAAFLGYRGLLRQAIDRQEWTLAADLARRAEMAHPGAPWLRAERARLALRTGSWAEALTLTGPEAPRAVIATAAAEASADPIEALRLAKEAFAADPSLAPAVIGYARRLRLAHDEKRADKVLVHGWEAAPHPDIGDAFLEPSADPLARMKRAEQLAAAKPQHGESHLLLARAALAAKLVGEARRQAERAIAAGLDQRRVWLLLADIEEAGIESSASAASGPAGSGPAGSDPAGAEAQAAALRRALRHIPTAAPDPRWRCAACGTDHAAWQASCTHCGRIGEIGWTAPARTGESATGLVVAR